MLCDEAGDLSGQELTYTIIAGGRVLGYSVFWAAGKAESVSLSCKGFFSSCLPTQSKTFLHLRLF